VDEPCPHTYPARHTSVHGADNPGLEEYRPGEHRYCTPLHSHQQASSDKLPEARAPVQRLHALYAIGSDVTKGLTSPDCGVWIGGGCSEVPSGGKLRRARALRTEHRNISTHDRIVNDRALWANKTRAARATATRRGDQCRVAVPAQPSAQTTNTGRDSPVKNNSNETQTKQLQERNGPACGAHRPLASRTEMSNLTTVDAAAGPGRAAGRIVSRWYSKLGRRAGRAVSLVAAATRDLIGLCGPRTAEVPGQTRARARRIRQVEHIAITACRTLGGVGSAFRAEEAHGAHVARILASTCSSTSQTRPMRPNGCATTMQPQQLRGKGHVLAAYVPLAQGVGRVAPTGQYEPGGHKLLQGAAN
jgi:hypothetical protein